ncbi:MAG: hypothetical protein HZB31_00020 [Nitrospirae bacterium]|nr:hypothetical protein [Nitrospirota bacterium]
MDKPTLTSVFDYRALRLLMGLIAFSLPIVVSLIAPERLTSISASYYSNARDVFVGLLFVVGSFLFAYNGHTESESASSKVASIAAVFVAICPTSCDGCPRSFNSLIHYVAAAVLFSILAYFCFIPFRQDIKGLGGKKARRSGIYLISGVTMIGCMVVISTAHFLLSPETMDRFRITYYGEAIALMAFGVAWIASGKFFRLIADDDELYYLFGGK